MRIKGEGFTRMRGHGRGDQIVQIIVKTPKNVTKRQEEILREFEELSERKVKGEDRLERVFQGGELKVNIIYLIRHYLGI